MYVFMIIIVWSIWKILWWLDAISNTFLSLINSITATTSLDDFIVKGNKEQRVQLTTYYSSLLLLDANEDECDSVVNLKQ